jgi:cytoskeletal protein CcmA (bactofilin family)
MPHTADVITNKISPDRSLIGESVMIKGELISDEDVIIQGGVDGIIYLKNNSLALGPHALIKATLFVKSMVAQGEVNGDVYASDQVVLKKPCHHTGNIHAPRISIESGAMLMGDVEMEAQNIEHAFATLSGSVFAQDKQAVNEQDRRSANENNRQQSMPNGAKDWPIFYPRS